VSGWDSLFLGTIAAATLVMAALQVGAVIAAARVVRRVDELSDRVQREVGPLIARATEIAEEARRTAGLATQQMERVDRMVAELALRVTDTAELLQRSVAAPIREGTALMAGIRAGLAALRGLRETARAGRVEDEDALFIG
jgi:hypothetical protein